MAISDQESTKVASGERTLIRFGEFGWKPIGFQYVIADI